MTESQTLKKLELGERTIYLLGTAHVSKASIEEAERTIEEIRPDTVCIELDEKRYSSLENPDSWKQMDIIRVLKKKQGFLMLANIILAAYQKKMGEETGAKPGDEMLSAINKSKELDIPRVMVDRPISTTLQRAWAKNSFFGKIRLMGLLIATAFTKEDDITSDEIEKLKQSSEMDNMMKDLSSYMPAIKEVLIDERDMYLASKIWNSDGKTKLAVLGAGHLPGVKAHLENFTSGIETADTSAIENVPGKSVLSRIASWIIPALILGLIVTGFIIGGMEKGAELLSSWVLWNGVLAAIGAIAAGAHILTVLVSFIGAPFTSLCPFVGIGLFSGIVQAFIKKPTVRDMENLSEDATSIRGFYKNRILRVLLVFFFSSIGSSIGTFIGGASFVSIFSQIFGAH